MQEQDNAEKLTQTISDIVKFTGKIRDMDFDEAATKQFVVLPILTALGWNYGNIDTLEVFPEFGVGNGNKVDYAYRMKGNRWFWLSVSDGVPILKGRNLKTR